MLCSLNMSGSFQMTVESSDVIAIASLSDWLKILTPVFSTNEKQNQNQILLGSLRFFLLLRLLGLITLVLPFQKS